MKTQLGPLSTPLTLFSGVLGLVDSTQTRVYHQAVCVCFVWNIPHRCLRVKQTNWKNQTRRWAGHLTRKQE